MCLTTMFRIITAGFLAVALIADTLPFRRLMRWKKSLSGVESFRLPMALATWRNTVFRRLLPLGILCDSTLPPLILLFGERRSHEAKCFAEGIWKSLRCHQLSIQIISFIFFSAYFSCSWTYLVVCYPQLQFRCYSEFVQSILAYSQIELLSPK